MATLAAVSNSEKPKGHALTMDKFIFPLDFGSARGVEGRHKMRSPLTKLLVVLVFGEIAQCEAATVTYNFEPPAFAAGQTTPFLNYAPQIGSSAFRADFTSSPSANGLVIGTIASSPLFSGQSLFDPFPPSGANTLTITLNTPVTGVQVDFALFLPGSLQLSSSSGNVSAPTVPSTQYGTLTFNSIAPFTQFTLQGFDTSHTPTKLAIDNLVMTVVPEPSAMAILLAGGGLLFARRRP